MRSVTGVQDWMPEGAVGSRVVVVPSAALVGAPAAGGEPSGPGARASLSTAPPPRPPFDPMGEPPPRPPCIAVTQFDEKLGDVYTAAIPAAAPPLPPNRVPTPPAPPVTISTWLKLAWVLLNAPSLFPKKMTPVALPPYPPRRPRPPSPAVRVVKVLAWTVAGPAT